MLQQLNCFIQHLFSERLMYRLHSICNWFSQSKGYISTSDLVVYHGSGIPNVDSNAVHILSGSFCRRFVYFYKWFLPVDKSWTLLVVFHNGVFRFSRFCIYRPAYLSVFDSICMVIGQQYGCTCVFLKLQTKSLQNVWKSWREWIQVCCQRSQLLSIVGVIVRWHLHNSSHFQGWSIWQVLIGQKYFLNQWTRTLHSKLYRS